MNDLDMLRDRYPFLSIGRCGKFEIVGIVQNASKTIVSIYDYGGIVLENEKRLFLELGEDYWWNSNRKIPIDIFLRGEFDVFRKYLKSFNAKEFELVHGPAPQLGGLTTKRVKRKQIKIVRKM